MRLNDTNSRVSADASNILRSATVACDAENPMQFLSDALGSDPLELVILFMSPSADIEKIIPTAWGCFGDATVIGCSTAGEISQDGYTENTIVALGLPREHFKAWTTLIEDLNVYDPQVVVEELAQARIKLANQLPDWTNEFNFLLIDGMSGHEDGFALNLSSGWGPAPLFGGSAGDGTRFETTFIIYNNRVLSKDAAVVAHIRTDCSVKVFKTDHVLPTEQRMVVTHADPGNRLVHEINAEPAAQEYARLIGVKTENLTAAVLGVNPVVVRIAGQHYVRGIRNVTEDGSLLFTAAIDEGLVLSLAKTMDIVSHLENNMREMTEDKELVGVIACDCLYRRTDASENDVMNEVSRILRDFRIFGFSCYGELFHSMHVNQTLTGVAIFSPEQS